MRLHGLHARQLRVCERARQHTSPQAPTLRHVPRSYQFVGIEGTQPLGATPLVPLYDLWGGSVTADHDNYADTNCACERMRACCACADR